MLRGFTDIDGPWEAQWILGGKKIRLCSGAFEEWDTASSSAGDPPGLTTRRRLWGDGRQEERQIRRVASFLGGYRHAGIDRSLQIHRPSAA